MEAASSQKLTAALAKGGAEDRDGVAVDASAFMSRVDDLIQWRRNSLWSATAENIQGATIAGVDGSIELDLLRHLRVVWLHTTLVTRIHSDEKAYDGNPLPLRPHAQDLARLVAYVRAGDGSEASLFVEARYQASHTVDQAGLVLLPAQLVANAGIRARLVLTGVLGNQAALIAGVSLRDVTDVAPVDILGHPLPGRQWTAQLAWEEVVF